MAGKQVTELDALPSFTDTSLLPVHNGAGLKKGTLSQLTDYIAERFSNPNLLLNSNFRVDQRGYGTYSNNTTKPKYTLDRWISINAKVVYNIDGTVTITSIATTDTSAWFKQTLERTINDMCTLSCNITAVTGNAYLYNQTNGKKIVKGLNTVTLSSLKEASIELKQGASITIEWIKLEKGSKATTYVAPIYAEELKKCEYYYTKIELKDSSLIVAGMNDAYIYVPHIEMRTKPTLSVNKATIKFWNFTESDVNKAKTVNITLDKIVQSQGYDDVISFRGSFGSQPVQFGRIISSNSDFTVVKLDAEIY